METYQRVHRYLQFQQQSSIQAKTWDFAPCTALQQAQDFERVHGERTRPEARTLWT